EIADRVRVRDELGQVRRRLRDVGRRGAAAHALFEQADLALEVGELAGEVGEGLLGGAVGVLSDGAFTVAVPYVDGAVLVDASPGRLVARHCRFLAVPCPFAPSGLSPDQPIARLRDRSPVVTGA